MDGQAFGDLGRGQALLSTAQQALTFLSL